MFRRTIGALVALACLAVPVPPAGADPGTALLDFVVTYSRFGAGAVSASIHGVVLVGDGGATTGATVTGSMAANEPAATCPVTGTASGTIATTDGWSSSFAWTRIGDVVVMSVDGGTFTGTHTITSPVGNPCGASNVRARVIIQIAGDFPARARGHITIHRFPQSSGALGGVRLWAAPVAQNGAPWTCYDVHTGAVVEQGDLLTSPDPGVSCTPPAPYGTACNRVDAGGYHADAGSGTVDVTSACTVLSVTAHIEVPQSWVTVSRSAGGYGTTPWTCQATESLANRDETDYWVFCDVNLP